MTRVIDLNSDLGESVSASAMGNDESMLGIVSSANIACGFHAGNSHTMLKCCRIAVDNRVQIGAHVSYPDRDGFGRTPMNVEPEDLYDDVLYQLAALAGIAKTVGTSVRYVKPHGALYNRIVTDNAQADAVARAVRDFHPELPILGLANSAIGTASAAHGLRFVREAFTDRAYRSDGTLVPRSEPGAVVTNVEEVRARAVLIATEGAVIASDGGRIDLEVDSLCVHGDTPDAVTMAGAVRTALGEAHVHIEAFG